MKVSFGSISFKICMESKRSSSCEQWKKGSASDLIQEREELPSLSWFSTGCCRWVGLLLPTILSRYGHDPGCISDWQIMQQTMACLGICEPKAKSKYRSLQWLLWDMLLVWKLLCVPVMFLLEPVKSWKSEISVNSSLDYLFSFKLEHSSSGWKACSVSCRQSLLEPVQFLKSSGKNTVSLQIRALRGTKKMIRWTSDFDWTRNTYLPHFY